MTQVPRFFVVEEAGRTVVYIAGELDLSTRDEFRQRLSPLTGRVVVDLADVTFIDSTAIGVLIGLQNRLSSDSGQLRIQNPHDVPRRALEIVGLEEWID